MRITIFPTILLFLALFCLGETFGQPLLPVKPTTTNSGSQGNGHIWYGKRDCSVDLEYYMTLSNLELLRENIGKTMGRDQFTVGQSHPSIFVSVTFNGNTQLVPVNTFYFDSTWTTSAGENINLFSGKVSFTLNNVMCNSAPELEVINIETNLVVSTGKDYPVCHYIYPEEIFYGSVIYQPIVGGFIMGTCANNSISKQTRNFTIQCQQFCYQNLGMRIGAKNNDHTTFQEEIKVSPNPFRESLSLSFSNQTDQNKLVKLYNLQGQLIEVWNVDGKVRAISLPINSNLPKGIYFLKISNNNINQTKKLIKH